MVDTLETITISIAEYKELIKDQNKLNALEIGGVDNWEWYGESLSAAGFFDDEDEEDGSEL